MSTHRSSAAKSPVRGHLAASVALGVVLAACGSNAEPSVSGVGEQPAKDARGSAGSESTGEAVEPAADPRPGVQADGSVVSAVSWFDGGLAKGLERAEKEGKLVLADVGAYWCAPCRELDETIFVDPKVGAFVDARFVAVHVDAEKGEGPDAVERHHVQVYPTLLVLEASGVEKGRVVDVESARGLMESLETLSRGGNVLARMEARVAEHPDDLELAYEVGSRYAQSADREKAEALFARVLEGDPDNARGLAAKVLYDRAMFFDFKLDGDPDKAIASYRALQNEFPNSKEAERAHRQIGRALNSQGKPDEAIASLDAMLALRPDDPDLHSSYGWFSFRQRCRPDKGLAVVQRGSELEPDDAGFHYLAAELHHQLGDEHAALASIDRALEIEPMSAYYKRQQRRFAAAVSSRGAAAPH